MYDIDTRMMIYTYKYNLCVCMYVAITLPYIAPLIQ